ncbi:MAG TPA: hydantoinase/oxoprolinase family protein [Solirubrobacteraceae bacterium]|nr:hydantoinase/oxoprolinase family protein [Solirubrobacteraceae bacterium]
MATGERNPRVLAIDAGGTMTDTFIVDAMGSFVVGKAQTTPEDESVGFMRSADDALRYWRMDPEVAFPQIVSGIYSGTAMLNRLLERTGRKVGCIVSGGLEDYFKLERGIQTYLSFPYSDRLHVATHFHNEPLVSRELMRGVRGRIDLFGDEAIPLYEDEVRTAAEALIDGGVESIVVCLLYSWRNPRHEQRVRELIDDVSRQRGLNGERPDVFLSSELYPMRRDFPRLNSTLIEAYAAEPSREQLKRVHGVTKAAGAAFDLRIMAAHGGTISVHARELARTLISGPIGGVVGSGYLAEKLGLPNVVCTDIGGTSFDIALITDGEYHITPTPELGRYVLNLPMIRVDSIGAGTGSFVRINPNSNRPELGPDSAGSRIGVCWPDGAIDTPSVSDLNLVLGRLNADYFLGGDVKLDVERARAAIEEQVARPLGLSVEHAAAGILELFDETLQYEATGQVLGKGYSPVDYALFCYGGGGPLHVAGYTNRTPYRDVLVPAWAAGFSAFGCACADLEYRYDVTIDLPIPPGAGAEAKQAAAAGIQQAWDALRRQVTAEFAKSGAPQDQVAYRHLVRMQYAGQLNDIEIYSPAQELQSAADIDRLIAAFEDAYGKIYARSAKSPELGYLVTHAMVTGAVAAEKPALPVEPLADPEPTSAKDSRQVWWRDGWLETAIFEQSDLRAGNVIAGPAIVESPADTLAIPPERRARLDQHRIFHLDYKES